MREPYADEALSALLDGELDDEARVRLESELARDADLRDELEQLRRVRAFLLAKGPAEAPPDFLAKVLGKVENEPMPANSPMASFLRRPFGVPLEALAVAAVALFVVLAGVGVGGGALFSMEGASAPVADPEMKIPAAPTEAPPPADVVQEQHLDPAPADGNAQDRQIDIQGVQYGDKAFGRGKTAEQLGIDGTAGATRHDLGTGTTDQDIPALDAAKKEMAAPKAALTAPSTSTAPTSRPEPVAVAKPTTSTTSTASTKAPATSSWRYIITAERADVLADLLSIAARTGGYLVDGSGLRVTSSDSGGDSGTYYVVVPADRVAQLDSALRQLGSQLSGRVDGSLYASGQVAVEVRIVQFVRKDDSGSLPKK